MVHFMNIYDEYEYKEVGKGRAGNDCVFHI